MTADAVWDALAEIPDPEIPTVSLVDLGVIREVDVEDGRVRVSFMPTFLGCPAVAVMRNLMADRIRELGAEPEVEVAACLLYTSPSPRDRQKSRMPSSA